MGLFGWKSGREGSRPALSGAGSASGSGGWTGWAGAGVAAGARGYEAQVREAYLGNAVAQRAVKLVVEGVGSAPLDGSDPALVALVAARSGGQMLIETVAAQLLLHGNAYVQVLRGVEGGGGLEGGGGVEGGVAELYALRPERVSVEADANGWPAAYRYAVGARVTRLSADPVRPEVIHLKAYHPVDDHYGLGCLGAAAAAVGIHNAAARWNTALLDNAARPSGALVYDPGDGSALSADQFARLKGELEASFAGSGNAGRPMLLEGGLKWQALSLSPADMDFAGTRSAAAREIALAFGVPPMLLGLPGDNSYANYREANRALWRLAILPLATTVLTGIAQGLSGWFEGAALRVDLDRVPALVEDRERLWGMVSAATFLSDAEKRAMLDVKEAGS